MAAVLPVEGWGAGGSAYVANLTDGPTNGVSQYGIGAGGLLAAKSPATVASGLQPIAVAVSPDGKSVYVTNSDQTAGSGSVSQYDVGAGGGAGGQVAADGRRRARGRSGWPSVRTARVSMSQTTTPPRVSQYDVGAGGLLAAKSPATVDDGRAARSGSR